ncbi:hypothetical protein [Pseudanabaena sp. 'Roaring Creek']|uniref:hypothetical protein n=1 Tax=Pseudanabaena sp. 'Roaring Creek' TaxID=1681830 RepID=UPI0006D81880|nr:hypothetical protein [Pseudanabaena sp. 'Roaring Creek']
MLDITNYLIYQAWLELHPCRSVDAIPKLGAIAMAESEVFRDPCSDRLFFAKHHSEKSIPVNMPTISMSFASGSSAEIQAIASGTDYDVFKEFKQRYLFTGNVNQNGFGTLEPSQRATAKYAILLNQDAVIECEGYQLNISDSLANTQSIILKPDGMFSVMPSLFGKKIKAYLQVVLLETVIINKNKPLPRINLNTVLKSKEADRFFFATIQNCFPVLEQFDPDASTICLRLAFDAIAVNLEPLSDPIDFVAV